MWTIREGYYSKAVIELRQDGPVPVLVAGAGTYPEMDIVDERGRTLHDASHVLVWIAGTWSSSDSVVTRTATQAGVIRVEHRPAGNIQRQHGSMKLVPAGTYEEQVRALVAAVEPMIASALVDTTVLEDRERDERRLWSALEGLPQPLHRQAYEEACQRADIEPKPDGELDTYGYRYMDPHFGEVPVERLIDHHLGQRRAIAIEQERKEAAREPAPLVRAGTRAAALAAAGFDPVALGGRVIDEQVFKPDASPAPAGKRCARCRTTRSVAWISGAGEYLCVRHQDDY